ncbi:outer membrane beta-barrel protein [Brenneria populi subsp. brevivirga]|uniref:outer membrane protein n=1 Tax=Brenneria populi TaxID=1505588 RepID=UPI002E195056|nr:outer membrane beta-barrel protein [Brenneria populi subsp. brevivirga]
MKKKIKIILLSSIFSSFYAGAHGGTYLMWKLGSAKQSVSHREFTVSEHNVNTGEPASASADMGHSAKRLWLGGVGLGYNFYEQFDIPVRLELEYNNRQSGIQSSHRNGLDFNLLIPNNKNNELNYVSKIKTQLVMLNGYLDLFSQMSFHPYIYAGIGRSMNNITYHTDYRVFNHTGTVNSVSKSNTKFAWSLGAGIGKELSQRWFMNTGYTFTHLGKVPAYSAWNSSEFGMDASLTSQSSSKIQYHDVFISLAYVF